MEKKLLLALSMLVLTACSSASTPGVTAPSGSGSSTPSPSSVYTKTLDGGAGSGAEIEIGSLPPVENRRPNTGYSPAFAGQTRVAGVKTKAEYRVEVLSSDLDSPWAVTSLPDGRLVITEKGGTLRIATVSGELSPKLGGFPAVDDRSQGGLLDVAPSPDFTTSRLLYFTLAERTGEGSLTAVGRGRLSDDETQIEDFTIIYRAVPYYDNSMHFGSRLVFDQAGDLFVSTGERSDLATRPMAQTLDNGYGKVLKITKDGKPAAANPFIGKDGILPEIYSYGHRNGQGLAIHPETGDLYQSEMGPKGGDELNLVLAGRNYGWPIITYGIEYSGRKVGEGLTELEGMEQPVYYWDPVLAASGMTFYTGAAIPEWKNDLFIGGLAGSHIARLVIQDRKVIGEERLLADDGQRFRDVGEGLDGALYAVTDEGRLYRIGR